MWVFLLPTRDTNCRLQPHRNKAKLVLIAQEHLKSFHLLLLFIYCNTWFFHAFMFAKQRRNLFILPFFPLSQNPLKISKNMYLKADEIMQLIPLSFEPGPRMCPCPQGGEGKRGGVRFSGCGWVRVPQASLLVVGPRCRSEMEPAAFSSLAASTCTCACLHMLAKVRVQVCVCDWGPAGSGFRVQGAHGNQV